MAIANGEKIGIRFTQRLVGNVTGLEPPLGYKKKVIDLSDAVVTTLNRYSTSYPGSKAIDGDTSTCWRGTTEVNWLQLQLTEAKVVTQLKLYLSSYYVKTFTISASNDGETWVRLGGEYTAASSTTAQWYTFAIDNTTPYSYYRIDILTAYSSSRVQIYELDLYEDVPTGNETKFTVSFYQYDYVPDGPLSKVARPVTKVERVDDYTILLYFDPGNTRSIQRAVGDITVSYDGSGSLIGQGGPVLSFEQRFTPEGLDPKNNPNDVEHISVNEVDINANLIRVVYKHSYENEHMNLVDVQVNASLTRIDDI